MAYSHPVQVEGRSPEEIKTAEKKAADEKIKNKTAKKQPTPRYFTIKLDCLIPCQLTYRILAEDEEEAFKQMKTSHPVNIKQNLPQKRPLKATVYEYGMSSIKLVKHLKG